MHTRTRENTHTHTHTPKHNYVARSEPVGMNGGEGVGLLLPKANILFETADDTDENIDGT